MMKSEFIERTGFEPTDDEYRKIEEAYYEYDGDKDAFCKSWIEEGGIQRTNRERIAKIFDLEDRLVKAVEQIEAVKNDAEKRIAKLNEELDRELEWKPCDTTGTTFEQRRYEELANAGGTKILTDEEAKDLIHREFGFDPEQIRIVTEVDIYEVNKYRRLRKKDTYQRRPVYNASDWNYIRFDCAGWFWEMVNCSLEKYYC